MKFKLRKGEEWQELRLENSGYCFGGGGGGDTNTTSTGTTTSINYSPEEAARRSQVMDEAANIYNQTAPSMASSGYPGANVVGQSADTLTGQNLMRQGAGTVMNQINAAQNAGNMAGDAVSRNAATSNWQNQMMAQNMQYGLTGALDVRNNPYLAQAMQAAVNPVTDAWRGAGGALAQQRQAAQGAGQVGSSRAGIAEGITNRAYLQKVGDITSQMGAQAYQQGQDTYSKTLAQIPAWQKSATENANAANEYLKNQAGATQQITNAAQAPGAMYSAVGAQNENLQREIEDYYANSRMWGLNAPWIPLQNYASIVYGGSSPSTSASSSSSSTAPRNSLGQVVGGGLTAASLAGMMM